MPLLVRCWGRHAWQKCGSEFSASQGFEANTYTEELYVVQ